jgi:hypothetical protein
MSQLRARQLLEQEAQEAKSYTLGQVKLDTTKLLLIYARQSTSKQFVRNIYSAIDQRDGHINRAYDMGWKLPEQYILYVENQLAKKTHVSGALRIDQRPGLQAIAEVIDPTGIIARYLNEYFTPGTKVTLNESEVKEAARAACKASAILVSGVDRLTRDPDAITPIIFANMCRLAGVLIITDDYIFDFNNPKSDDMGIFMNEAIAAKEYSRKQIKGKMLKRRTLKAETGHVANGTAPIGLMLDEERNNLVPSVRAERVDWLYGRYRTLAANRAELFHEIINMAKRGEPLFLPHPSIDEKSMHCDRMERDGKLIGWTIKSWCGLNHILSNPMYAGHLVFNHRVVKRNAHPAIVNLDNWEYAFWKESKYDLDGNLIERPKRTVRFTQKDSEPSTALLAGTRHDGRPVIDGVNGTHVYVRPANKTYSLFDYKGYSVYGFEGSIRYEKLDPIIAERNLYWLQVSRDKPGQTPYKATSAIEKAAQPLVANTLQSDLALTTKDLARVRRALETSADVMDDTTLRQHYEKEASLLKRQAELERAIADRERIAREQELGKRDIEQCVDKWPRWDLEKRREFIKLATDAITLEKLEKGILRLTIIWSPLMGFIWPTESSTRAYDTAIIQQRPLQVSWSHDYIHDGVTNDNYRSGSID